MSTTEGELADLSASAQQPFATNAVNNTDTVDHTHHAIPSTTAQNAMLDEARDTERSDAMESVVQETVVNATDCTEEEKPPPREHGMEQEVVDYEEDEIDTIPIQKPEKEKPSSSPTGERQQPAKISWNAWAGHDNATKRPTETKKPEKRRDTGDGHRNDRRTRDEMHHDIRGATRIAKGEAARFQPEYQRGGRDMRDRSPPFRRQNKNYHPRPYDVHYSLKRGLVTPTRSSGIPPGMNYIKGPPGPHFVHSSPVDTGRNSTRPVAARMMPPGLGVSGAVSRNFMQTTQQRPPGNRRNFAPRQEQFQRGNSPPMRHPRPSRPVSSPGRHERYRRPPNSPQNEPITPMQRSPYRNDSQSQPERNELQRSLPRRQPQYQHRDEQQLYRTDGQPCRVRDSAPASPRRYTPPDKRFQNRRYPDQRQMEQEFNRTPPFRPPRLAPSGQATSPRDYRRRVVTTDADRGGSARRLPPTSMHEPIRHLDGRTRRDIDASFHRRDEASRVEFPTENYDHRRMYGVRYEQGSDRRGGESHAGRYGDPRRDPPPSPGREIKRQRQSPSTEQQRFRRDPSHYRSNAGGSPHENPPTDDIAGVMRSHYPENECAWYYVDPQGNTQGPCTIEQFRSWLRTLADDPQFADEHRQFMSVDVWKEGQQNRQVMTDLLERNAP